MRKQKQTFSVVQNATNTKVMKVTGRYVREMTAALKEPIWNIRHGQTDLKRKLPAVCWAANFTDERRHAESATPTGLAYIDIDHVSEWYENKGMTCSAAQALYIELFDGKEYDLGIVHAQISPSGDGLHIVFIPANGTSLEASQKTFAEMAGLQEWDKACHDIGRMLFLSSIEDTLYDVLDILEDD